MKNLFTKVNELFEVQPEDGMFKAYNKGAAKGYLVGVTVVGAIAGVIKIVESVKGNNDDSETEELDFEDEAI